MNKVTAVKKLESMKKKELSKEQIREAFARAEARRAAEKSKNQKHIER